MSMKIIDIIKILANISPSQVWMISSQKEIKSTNNFA